MTWWGGEETSMLDSLICLLSVVKEGRSMGTADWQPISLPAPFFFSKQLKMQTNQEQTDSLPDSGVRGSLCLARLLAWQVQRG